MTLVPVFFLSQWILLTTSIDSDCNGGECTHLSTVEKQAILDLHNELRDRVAGGGLLSQGHPTATDMNYLIWDDGLEAVAQTYSETCPGLVHNPDSNFQIKYQRDATSQNTKWGTKNGPTWDADWCGSPSGSNTSETCIAIGENLLVSTPNYDLNQILNQIETKWWDEYTVWTYGMTNSGCNPNNDHSSCGHYTQMAWANTRYIGCGYVNGCTGRWRSVFVCNYFPPGNFNGDSYPPYTAGSGSNHCGSNCASDRTQCKSIYLSRSITAASYPDQPYDALCGGGACPTMCDGSAHSVLAPNYCNMCTPSPLNMDCNDGTIAIDNGRDICSWSNAPSKYPIASPTSNPSGPPTDTPSTNPVTQTPTDAPTKSPTEMPSNDPTKLLSKTPTRSPTGNTQSPSANPIPGIPSTANPSVSPSNYPTTKPSFDPTKQPTKSPTRDYCEWDWSARDGADVVLLVDASCAMTEEECKEQQFFVAET
eukprot:11592_1